MKGYKQMISDLSNHELLKTWTTLGDKIKSKEILIEEDIIEGWLMDEIEKRFPEEFDEWFYDGMEFDLENYIELEE